MSTDAAIDPLIVERERGYAEGWAEARKDAGDCWCPVPIRWRLVAVGDAIIGPKDGRIWLVRSCGKRNDGQIEITVERAGVTVGPVMFDPDAQVQILEQVAMLDAMKIHREELGARVMEGRET